MKPYGVDLALGNLNVVSVSFAFGQLSSLRASDWSRYVVLPRDGLVSTMRDGMRHDAVRVSIVVRLRGIAFAKDVCVSVLLSIRVLLVA